MSSARAAPATSEAMTRELNLREKPQLQCKLNIVRTVSESQLLLDPLLVGVHRLRADEQTLADLRGGIALCHELENILLALRQLFEAPALGCGRIFLREVLRQDASGSGANVDVAVRNRAHRVHQLAIGGAFDQITRRARFHERNEIVLFRLHRQYEHAGVEPL